MEPNPPSVRFPCVLRVLYSVPARRQDSAVVWEGRDRFLDQAPVREGDFFHVPRIIARDDLEMEEEE